MGCVLSEQRQVKDRRAAEREMPKTVCSSSVKGAIACNYYLTKDTVAAMVTSVFENGETYSDDRLAVILQAMLEKSVSNRLHSVQFELLL